MGAGRQTTFLHVLTFSEGATTNGTGSTRVNFANGLTAPTEHDLQIRSYK